MLDVSGSVRFGQALIPSVGSDNYGIVFPSDPGGGSGDSASIKYWIDGTGENTKLRIMNNNDADDEIEFFQYQAPRMTIYNGNVGIGTGTPATTLEVSGTASKTGGGSWSTASDQRLKKNIRSIDSDLALHQLSQLQGRTFDWINPSEHGQVVTESGFVAQEVETVFPNWVIDVDPKGQDKALIPAGQKSKMLSLPTETTALIIESVKALKRRGEVASQDIKAISEENKKLQDAVKTLAVKNQLLQQQLDELRRLVESKLSN